MNYGRRAQLNGSNVSFKLAAAGPVTFIYDHKTHLAADSVSFPLAFAVGDFQKAAGCKADDAPDCLRTWLQDPDGDGVYVFTTDSIPAGSYKAALRVNAAVVADFVYFQVQADAVTSFIYNPETGSFRVQPGAVTPGAPIVQPPDRVVIPGTLQSKLGCPGDWLPDCDATGLAFNPVDEIWRGEFDIPRGDYEYKAALNGSWYWRTTARGAANGPDTASTGAGHDGPVLRSRPHALGRPQRQRRDRGRVRRLSEGAGCPDNWRADCLRGRPRIRMATACTRLRRRICLAPTRFRWP